MLFISAEDFFAQVKGIPPLTREDERRLAQQLPQDPAAREQLIRAYMPTVAAYIRRAPQELHTLQTVYVCLDSLEKGVDSFNFLQDSETFAHHLSWRLRNCITRCLADRN
jgi:hypothetical protein